MALQVDLSERRALVTGASRGIGEAVSRRLAACGAEVLLAARSVDRLEALASSISAEGGRAMPVPLDIADAEAVQEILSGLPEGEPVTVLVNNAGMTRDNLMMRMKDEEWDEVQRVDLGGPFRVTRALLRPMMKARWGRIVNVSSVVAQTGNPGQVNYAAAKAGLHGFTRSLAREVAGRGITVNAVAPGFIETAMTEGLPEKVREEMLGMVPLARFGSAEEVADAIVFLCSEEAAYITGHVLGINGGMYM